MATLKEIAEMADVSISTVSRILNSDTSLKVSDQTRNNVIRIAEQLQYHKKVIITKDRPVSIAVLTVFSEQRESNDIYWRDIYVSIERAARQRQVNLTSIIRINQNLKAHHLENYDAVIIIGDLAIESIQKIKQLNHNIVTIDAKVRDNNIDSITPDLEHVTIKVLDQLMSSGRQHIGFIGGYNTLVNFDNNKGDIVEDVRTRTYRRWCKHNNREELMYISQWRAETGTLGAQELLDQYPSIDALLVGSDPIAVGAINTIKSKGLVPGKDIAIVSYNNLDLVAYLDPALTSIDLNHKALGESALVQSIELAQHEKNWATWITIPSNIVYRSTFNQK